MTSTGVDRKFGTDLSNLRTEGSKGVSKKKSFYSPSKSSKQIHSLPQEWRKAAESLKKISDAVTPSPFCPPEVPKEIEVPAIAQTSNQPFRYTRNFLISLRQKSESSIEGLLPEVSPGYVDQTRIYPFSSPAVVAKTFSNRTFNYKSENGPTTGSPSIVGDASVKPNRATLQLPIQPLKERSLKVDAAPFEPLVAVSTIGIDAKVVTLTGEIQMPKVPKKVKKEKAKETDERRLAARQKQIDIGVNTPGYRRYLEEVDERKKGDPKTPDKYQVCSKRSWDGQVRKWRRQLHQYDPDEILLDDDFLKAVNEEDIPALSKKLGINLTEIFAQSSSVVVA